MAPVRFIGPPDLSGRTPIYRLAKTVVPPAPPPQPPSQPQPSPSQVNNAAHPHPAPYQPPYHPHPHAPPPPSQSQSHPHPSPYNSPYTPSKPAPQTTPQENKENAPAPTQTPQGTPAQGTGTGTPASSARGSPLTKRRGRKLQESEVLILVNCCLEYQSIFHDNPTRFWYCVGVSLKRQIKRNFSWQSCRQIIEELVSERRERRRDVAAGKVKEQPITELVLATDKWISVCDAVGGASELATPGTTQSLKRPGQPESPGAEANNANSAKRPKQNDQVATRPPPPPPPPTQAATGPPMPYPPYPPYPMPPHHMPPAPIPTIPSGPTMAEFQTLKVDIQSLRMDVQSMRRDMIEVRNDINAKLDLILKTLQEGKETKEDKEDDKDKET
ncbi:hypothetical protein BJX68DRAFT_91366 [Aspergillus pseudodeflectus]|uniref:VASP tetramerisation domain-containing protein n=1 Tax=Aspergillus pseudodeflectus TaxID=176178 RepID=A0ABR4KE39_9EURO